MNTSSLKPLYHALLENMGNQGDWPAESPEEIIVGAILVQNTRWENVELLNRGEESPINERNLAERQEEELCYL